MAKKYQVNKMGKVTRVPDSTPADATPKSIEDVQKGLNQIKRKVEQTQQEYKEVQQANERSERMRQSDHEALELTELLTLQKLRETSARPLIAEVVMVVDGVQQAKVIFKPRRSAPGPDGNAMLSCGNFFRLCEEAEANITLLPDPLRDWKRPVYLKRVQPQIGMRVRMYYMFDNHPLGWGAPINWGAIVDSTLTAEDIAGTGKTSDATQTNRCVVEGVRGMGDGTVTVTVKLDDGGVVSISMLPDAAPVEGAKGTISYEGADPVFTPDNAV